MIRSYLSKRVAAKASKASPRPRFTSPRVLTLVVAILVAAFMSAALAPVAQAYRVTKSGYPGSIRVSLAYTGDGQAGEIGPYVYVNPRNIGESPQYANRAQHIMIAYRLWDYMQSNIWPYDSRWVRVDTAHAYGDLTAAQTTLRDGGAYFPNNLNKTRFGFDIVVRWYLKSTGQLIGKKTVDYDVGPYGEFRCASPYGCMFNTAIDWINPSGI